MSFAVSGAWYGACTSREVNSNLTSTLASSRSSEGPGLVEFHPRPRAKEKPMAGRQEEGSVAPKTVQYTWRGLRMVGEASLFDLPEPVWHPDEKVAPSIFYGSASVLCYSVCTCLLVNFLSCVHSILGSSSMVGSYVYVCTYIIRTVCTTCVYMYVCIHVSQVFGRFCFG